MKSKLPKQFLPLKSKPLILHCLEAFLRFSFISEIVIVCEEKYRSFFSSFSSTPLLFADPGQRRQDSLASGLKKISSSSHLVCIHDTARPFVEKKLVQNLLKEALLSGAATLGMPIAFTVKECTPDFQVVKTLPRKNLWEIQTPQVIQTTLLKRALLHAQKRNIEVTDDVSLVEHLGGSVKVIQGFFENLKITYPSDMLLAEKIYEKRQKKI